ncbi:MAG: hypothetical protein M3209_04280 [Acidobacteriota bacterium]|nr:hypothetical protein [Acidobacteriota bacterium]
MIKKCLSFALCCLLLAATNSTLISAQTNTNNNAASAAKIKANVAKRGTGENKRVVVKRLDGTKLKGYISQASEDSFTLVVSETNQPVSLAYGDVAQLKNSGSKGDTIALWIIGGAAAVGAIVLGSALLTRCRNEGGC